MDKLVQVVQPGQIVVDPFMGSGTTGVSCMNTGRKFVGIEVTEHFFDISCKRIEEAWRARPRLFNDPIADHPELFTAEPDA
jgi:site-specific DNA-methyltransferase (adenine-specific)